MDADQLDPRQIAALLDRLAAPDVTTDEAEMLMAALDGHEATALPVVFRAFRSAREPLEVHAAARLLGRWTSHPVGAALRPALEALVAEDDVADLVKIAAGGLLEQLGAPLEGPALAAQLDDPAAVAQRALQTVLAASAPPLALVSFLDGLADVEQEVILRLIDDLAALEADRAERLLVPLTHHPEAEVAVSAIAALDRLGAAASRPTVIDALTRVAAVHPAREVRAQAELTVERLDAETDAGGARSPDEPLPHDRARRPDEELPDERSPNDTQAAEAWADAAWRVVQLLRPSAAPGAEAEAVDVLTLTLHPTRGIREYAAVERVRPAGLESVRRALEERGRPLAPVERRAAAAHLREATARVLEAGGSERLGFLAWPAVLHGR